MAARSFIGVHSVFQRISEFHKDDLLIGTIEPRYGATVYISDAGKVCIQQDLNDGGEPHTLIFEEDEAAELIDLLQQAQAEFNERRRVAEENENN